MDLENLVRMANRIGDFFDAMPDQEEALSGIAQHLRRYWEPRMRLALVAHADGPGGRDLKPLVAMALQRCRESLTTAAARH